MSGYPAGTKEFDQLLPSSVGYGVVAGVGAFFAVLMSEFYLFLIDLTASHHQSTSETLYHAGPGQCS